MIRIPNSSIQLPSFTVGIIEEFRLQLLNSNQKSLKHNTVSAIYFNFLNSLVRTLRMRAQFFKYSSRIPTQILSKKELNSDNASWSIDFVAFCFQNRMKIFLLYCKCLNKISYLSMHCNAMMFGFSRKSVRKVENQELWSLLHQFCMNSGFLMKEGTLNRGVGKEGGRGQIMPLTLKPIPPDLKS